MSVRRKAPARPAGEWLTTRQAADYVHLSEGTLRNYRHDGVGPHFTTMPNGQIRYTKAELDQWITGANGDQ
jgi:hypothetical protein